MSLIYENKFIIFILILFGYQISDIRWEMTKTKLSLIIEILKKKKKNPTLREIWFKYLIEFFIENTICN